MDIGPLLQAVSQIGFPIFVGVWGIWFLTFRVWPDHKEMQAAQAAALMRLADATEALANAHPLR